MFLTRKIHKTHKAAFLLLLLLRQPCAGCLVKRDEDEAQMMKEEDSTQVSCAKMLRLLR